MGFKDLFKDVTDLAKDSIDSIQAEVALRKEEQQRLREEMEQRIKSFTDGLIAQLLNNTDPKALPFINASDEALMNYTQDFFEKLLLPANSSSATKIDMHPNDEKALKNILKTFPNYKLSEKFLFRFKDSKSQIILVTTSNLYFKVVFPENNSFFCVGSVPKEKIVDISLNQNDEEFQLLVNNITLISSTGNEVKRFDFITLSEYLYRIKTNDFTITDDQVDAFIQSKLDPATLAIVKTITEPNENLVYFAWGLDSAASKKFLLCTDKQILLYNRDLDEKKSFDYNDITSLTTKQSTVTFLDLSLTLGMNPNDTEIHTKDFIETISIFYSREAERVIQIYNDHKPEPPTRESSESPSSEQSASASQQPETPKVDPIAMIEKLAGLKDKGIITEDEFNQKKKDLLEKL